MILFFQILGWISTILVLVGYFLNAKGKPKPAMTIWLIGDIGWLFYDLHIFNWSHFALSIIIMGLNFYGIYRIIKEEKKSKGL